MLNNETKIDDTIGKSEDMLLFYFHFASLLIVFAFFKKKMSSFKEVKVKDMVIGKTYTVPNGTSTLVSMTDNNLSGGTGFTEPNYRLEFANGFVARYVDWDHKFREVVQ
jgi:hypothetical protein